MAKFERKQPFGAHYNPSGAPERRQKVGGLHPRKSGKASARARLAAARAAANAGASVGFLKKAGQRSTRSVKLGRTLGR